MTSSPATILHEALQRRDPDERAAFLEDACGDDPALRAEVHRLIRAHDAAGDFLSEPAVATDATLQAPLSEGPGTVIDRYKLLQLIGEGGFGAVYMAEQQAPVRRRVALKIIKLGMDTKQVIARFEAERQALAMMDHPNIAKVLDAGATETGRPYFVMELVKGEPITEYCDRHNLPVQERLKLFQQVCNAVQHAHQKGIIHRDIKPSNVMITLHDGRPVPKVIDFGIAKATNARLTEKTVFTEFRQFIGTPEYMSPEQAEMSGLDIDTRSDVYSLGVLLYELLTGTTPFDGKTLRSAGYGEIQRMIREQTPLKPSTRLSSLETLADVAQHRHTEPRKLGLIIRGDLDWIVMKALEKDRTRRYETANGFAMDIGRYLDDEPVVAGPPSASYKLRKLIKRNKGAFTAAAIVFLVLTLGVMGTTWGLISANAQAERAEHELSRANEVKRLITEMFNEITPAEAQGSDTTLLKSILDDTAERLAAGEVSDELIAAELHRIIGDVYRQMGLYEDGENQLRLAVRQYEHVHGPEHGLTRSAEGSLALLYMYWGRFDEAETIFTSLLEDARIAFGEDNPFVLKTMTNLAVVLRNLGRYAEAEELFVQALESKKRVKGLEDLDTLRCMNNLGALYWSLMRYDEAEPLFTDVLEIRERVLGEKHPETLGSMMNLANLHRMQGEFDDAERLYVKALSLMRSVLSNKHPRTTLCMSNLASLYLSQERFEEAEPLMKEALESRRERLGPEHEDTLGAMSNLGILYNATGQYEDALVLLEPAVAIMRRDLYPDHPFTRISMEALVETYTRLGLEEKALAVHRHFVHMRLAATKSPDARAETLNSVAWLLCECDPSLRDPEQAVELAQRACSMEERSGGDNLWNYLDTLALAQHMTGDTAAAFETQQRALSHVSDDADPAIVAQMQAQLRTYEAALAAGTPVSPGRNGR